jgi:predicted transcriptional regulator
MSLERSMPTDNQIAAMVEIAQSAGSALSKQQKSEIDTLIKAGLVERSLEKYQLTSAGQKVLDDRGVGANEA